MSQTKTPQEHLSHFRRLQKTHPIEATCYHSAWKNQIWAAECAEDKAEEDARAGRVPPPPNPKTPITNRINALRAEGKTMQASIYAQAHGMALQDEQRSNGDDAA